MTWWNSCTDLAMTREADMRARENMSMNAGTGMSDLTVGIMMIATTAGIITEMSTLTTGTEDMIAMNVSVPTVAMTGKMDDMIRKG